MGCQMRRRANIALIVILFITVVSLSISLYVATRGSRSTKNKFAITYSDLSYERTPDKSDLNIPKGEDGTFLETILTAIFEGNTKLSDEEKSIGILRYTAASIADAPNEGSATQILRDGFALCGGKSNVLIILCRKARMPARYVGSMYMPRLRSHALGEVFYEGRWHLFDATFGIFLYSNEVYDGSGYVISFHELISNPNAGIAFQVVPEAGLGRFDDDAKNFPITRLEEEPSLHGNIKRQELLSFYRKEMSEAFPVAFGSNDLVSYPIDADLNESLSRWYGQIDESDRDLAHYEARFSGSHYLGNSAPPGFHTWLIKVAPNSKIAIEYYSVLSNPPKLCVVPLRGARVIASSTDDKKTMFTLYVTDSDAIVSVYCPANTFSVDALHVYRCVTY